MKKWKTAAAILCLGIILTACSSDQEKEEQQEQTVPDLEIKVEDQDDTAEEKKSGETDSTETAEEEELGERREEIVVLDPGHSSVVIDEMEPLGPGSSEQKAADTSGTSGVSTGIPEYELTLTVSQKLKSELENRGYTVVLTRDSNDVPMSCVQRATVANDADADAFVRIHANGIDDSSVQGAMTICITEQNPFYPELYPQSRALSDDIINELCKAAGCENDGVWETDSMSGNNWSEIPATIVEMGYMTNPEEDQLMASEEYQNKMVQGIANGIDVYFGY